MPAEPKITQHERNRRDVFAVMDAIPDATLSQVIARTGVSHPTGTKYMRLWKAQNAEKGVKK